MNIKNIKKYRIFYTYFLSGIILFFSSIIFYNLFCLLFNPSKIKEDYKDVIFYLVIKGLLTIIFLVFTLILNLKEKSLILIAVLTILSIIISAI